MDRFFALTTEDKQAALDDAWELSANGDNTLLATLRLCEKQSRIPSLVSGNVIQSSASNGHTAQAFAPGAGAPSPIEFARVWRELKNLFERAFIWLGNPTSIDGCVPTQYCYRRRDTLELVLLNLPIAAPNDEQVDGLMRNWLVPVTESQGDYSRLITSGVPLLV